MLLIVSSATARSRDYWDWNWSCIASLHDAIEQYRHTHGDYPRTTPGRTWGLEIAEDRVFGRFYPGPPPTLQIYNVHVWDHDSSMLIDRWGTPFVYLPPGDPGNPGGEVILRSCGPNGIDEVGGGDDLRFENGEIRCNDGYHWKAGWPEARLRTLLIGFVFVVLILPMIGSVGVLRKHAASAIIVFLALGYIGVHGLWFQRLRYPYFGPIYQVYAGLLIIGVITFHTFRSMYRRSKCRARLSRDRCPTCEYDMAGLTTGRCPECGQSYTAQEVVTSP